MSERELWALPDGSVMENVHPAAVCEGRPCVMHNPTDHHMREWRMRFRNDTGVCERICAHGIGHPDPDSLAYFRDERGLKMMGVHGCDGCCRKAATTCPT